MHDMIYLRFETDPEQLYYLSLQRDQHILLLHQSLTFSEWKHIPIRRLYQAPVTITGQNSRADFKTFWHANCKELCLWVVWKIIVIVYNIQLSHFSSFSSFNSFKMLPTLISKIGWSTRKRSSHFYFDQKERFFRFQNEKEWSWLNYSKISK